MSESIKTAVFVSIAVVAVALAYFIDRPASAVNSVNLVNTSFTPAFEVDAPKQLTVIKWDPATAQTKQFEVASVDGVWRIPSKENYPADATRQMASAANALIDKKILRVAAQTADSHAELGVVDPQSEKLTSNSKGVGTHVIMKDADGNTLVDAIIGDKVKDAPGQRYVRQKGADLVYVVEVNPDNLSTSFSDWIEADLLKLSPFDIRRVFINDYSADLALGMTPDGRLAPHISWNRRNEFTLAYDNKDSKWNLAEMKKYDKSKKEMVPDKPADDEEVNQESLNELRNALDDLQIVDVARKPSGLSGDLKAGKDFLAQSNKETFQDLLDKGFSPVPLKAGADPEILSSEGEVVCTLRDGVEYVLRFGQLQIQTESAGETTEPSEPGRPGPGASDKNDAKAADKSADKTAADKDAKAGDAKSADAKNGEKKDADAKNLRRYLFVMARFNKDIIDKPKLKDLPPAPSAEKPAPGDPASAGGSATPAAGGDEPAAANKPEPTDETSPDKPKEEPKPDAKPSDAPKDQKPAENKPAGESASAAPPSDAKQAEGDANKQSEADKAAAERKAIEEENKRAQDEYNRTVEAGQKKVKELNERFGDWYYVISNDVYKKVHLGRAQVIKKKEKPADAKDNKSAAPNPLSGLPNLPAADEPAPVEPAQAPAPGEPASAGGPAPAPKAGDSQ
jgi:hypothetical protein